MDFHKGLRYQTGRGFGSIFSALARGLKPLAKMGLNAGKRFIKSDFAKNLGTQALDIGGDALKNVAINILEGRNVGEAANEQLQEAKQKIASTLKGSGYIRRKRKKNIKSNSVKKLKYSLLD